MVAGFTLSRNPDYGIETEDTMSNTKYARIIGTACAALVTLAACGGPEQVPGLVPNVEPPDVSIGRHDDLPSPDELKLCDRRVPIPRC